MPGTKLPHVGTSIFSVMSQLANEYGAINLSQGFPEFDGPQALKDALCAHVHQGANQYAPMPGVLPLQTQIQQLIERCYQRAVSLDEITVTSGATEALFVAIQALVRQGDEVIIFDPAYDSYAPAVTLAGGTPKHINLSWPDYRIDWEKLDALVCDKTRLIIINTPHNPSATCLSDTDIRKLSDLVCGNGLYLISDEVYEHLTFDGQLHQSIHRYPALAARSFIVSSFGKTFHMTGWKLGYCVGPESMMCEFRKIHQYVNFSSFTPAQLALADTMQNMPEHIDELHDFYQEKRDFFVAALKHSRFRLLPSQGTYFVLADYSDISQLADTEFAVWLTQEAGVAAIPLSVFYADHSDHKVVRFCFAKSLDTLKEAAERLCRL